MRYAFSFCALFAAVLPAAETGKPSVTFTKDVAPVLFHRCAGCHREGEVAPMSLLSYKEARPWAKSIKEAVLKHAMPPWLADPSYGHFANDRRLPQAEIDTLVAWADSGAQKGDDADLPPAPLFDRGWSIGKPDLVVSIPEEFPVPATGTVPYKYFTVPSGFTEDKWVQAMEIRPGNRAVVHHVIVFLREPGKGIADGDGGNGKEVETGKDLLLTGFAPGEQPKVYRPGTAKLIKAGSSFVFQVHYTPNGTAAKDRSYVGLIFAKEPVKDRAYTGNAMTFNFVIPAGDPSHEVRSSWTAKQDVHINGFMPHMHVRGKDFTYTAVYPDGRSEVVLSVPKYDFNWQLIYEFDKPLALPKGGRLDCVAHFDNSPNNKYNPDPTKYVKWGDQTWEEMMIGWFDYTVDPKPVRASLE